MNDPAERNGAPTLQVHGFLLKPGGLVAEGRPTFEQWQAVGEFLKYCEGAVQWWVGDWLNYGEGAYGERFAQAVEVTGLRPKTLQNQKWVAERVPPSRRRESLPWSHHAEVAALPPNEQDALLDRAEAERLTRAQVRAAVAGTTAADDGPEDGPGTCPNCGWRLDRRPKP